MMKGVLLAGGTGTRLGELTRAVNKHLLPVGDRPMICHPLGKMVGVGVADVALVTGPEHVGAFAGLLGSGHRHGCKLTYLVQEEPKGIAHALGLAKAFVGADDCLVILGDNIFRDDLRRFTRLCLTSVDAWIALAETEQPQRFGCPVFDERGVLTGVVEKPHTPPGRLAVAGVYFYRGRRTFALIDRLAPSARGELEITDLNNILLREGRLRHAHLEGWWTDAGTPESLALANKLIREI